MALELTLLCRARLLHTGKACMWFVIGSAISSVVCISAFGSRLAPRPPQPPAAAHRPWPLALLLVAAAETRPTLASGSARRRLRAGALFLRPVLDCARPLALLAGRVNPPVPPKSRRGQPPSAGDHAAPPLSAVSPNGDAPFRPPHHPLTPSFRHRLSLLRTPTIRINL